MTLDQALKVHYGLHLLDAGTPLLGAGGETCVVTCREGKFVVKVPLNDGMSAPQNEAALCAYLRAHHIPASEMIPNLDGAYLSGQASGQLYHVQRYVEGTVYAPHTAPDWLLAQSACMLANIHATLCSYPGLPEGIGPAFFERMTPQRVLPGFQHSLEEAVRRGDSAMICELRERIELLTHMPVLKFVPARMTCQPTHGDFGVHQLICGAQHIAAVIDWTAACQHPIAWEIVRPYLYAAPACKRGVLAPEGLCRYIREYRRFAFLSREDVAGMLPLFFYQSAVCDYHGQALSATGVRSELFLFQARFVCALLQYLAPRLDELTDALLRDYDSTDA